ncbi:TetR/AcrR family transcriptional regulator [Ravibacter arvi]|uniref:TetR/AcrR family transcriptional regulator n=1 Tax=Ravibacter arvi TaxID=2051041 RepID=A0ABP8LZ01_9BACT
MGISERKEREREDMQRLILNAARKLFLENGVEKTSIRAIADAIEYSPATIYLYFKDKNEIFYALHELAFLTLAEHFRPVSLIKDPFAQLVELGHLYIQWAVENPGLYELCFLMESPMEALACRDESWEHGKNSFGLLMHIIEGCMAAGYFKQHDPESAALTVWSYIHGLVTIFLRGRMKLFDDDRDIERIKASYSLFIKMVQHGL